MLVGNGGEPSGPQDEARADVPSEIIADAKAAFRGQTRRDTAHLEFDSLIDGSDVPEDYHLRFEHLRLTIELQISSIGPIADVTGLIHPPSYSRVFLYRDDADIKVSEAIVEGRFRFKAVGRGLIRLCLIPLEDRPSIWSDWFRV